jgi:predicted ribonuclease YlaK
MLVEEGTKENVILVTADFGLRLKAQARGIQCHTLMEEMLLPSKTPAEEEIAKLRERLQRLEHRLPKLSLKLLSQGKIADFGENKKSIPETSFTTIGSESCDCFSFRRLLSVGDRPLQ